MFITQFVIIVFLYGAITHDRGNLYIVPITTYHDTLIQYDYIDNQSYCTDFQY